MRSTLFLVIVLLIAFEISFCQKQDLKQQIKDAIKAEKLKKILLQQSKELADIQRLSAQIQNIQAQINKLPDQSLESELKLQELLLEYDSSVQLLSRVLKHSHDTVKNAIGNIR